MPISDIFRSVKNFQKFLKNRENPGFRKMGNSITRVNSRNLIRLILT